MQTQSLATQLGIKMRRLRKDAGLTQAQLAEIAQVSLNFMGNVERGQQVPSLKMVERIAHGLNVAPKVLFDFAEVSAETEDKERVHLYEALFAELPTCTPDDLRVLIQVAKQLGSKRLDQQSKVNGA